MLANTADVQAVTRSGLTMANFWRAGRVGNLFADNPLSVVQRQRGRDFEFALSDPTQLATTIRLRLLLPGARVLQADEGVTTRRTPLGVEITVDVKGAAGATRVVKVRLG